jgi:hypothetical protein
LFKIGDKKMKIGTFKLLPAAPDVCPECAVKHEPQEPHNKDSLFYQVKFFMEHNRYPTWADALSHCADGLKDAWVRELQKRGIEIDNKGEKK